MGRRLGLLVASVGVVLAASACGSGSSGAARSASHGDVLRVIQAAATTTANERSMQVRGSMHMDLTGASASAGAVDAAFSGALQTTPVRARLDFSQMQVGAMSLGSGITELITPDAFFMKVPMFAQQTGKPWLEMKFSDLKARSGLDLKQLFSQAQQMQPSQYIAQLTSSGDVHVVGTETVNGVHTTHYSGTVSLGDALSHMTSSLRAQLGAQLQATGITGSKIDVWLDGKGLVRRMQTSTLGGKGSMTISMDVLAYGVTVDVTPPPAGQVADLGQLAGSSSLG